MFYAKIPMFHVEHRVTMRLFAFLFITICLVGCNKPNPNPELGDEIYLDLKAQAESTAKEVEAEKKKFEGFKKDLDKAAPQTGEIKYAQKRYFESEAKVQKLEQLAKYYEIKTEARLRYTKTEYLKSFKAGKPWPKEEEMAAYKEYKLASQVPSGWDSRNRVKAYEKTSGSISSSGKGAEKGKEGGEKTEKGEKKPESESKGH